MGEFTTDKPVDIRVLGYTTTFAPLTITGPDTSGVVRIEARTMTDDDLAAAVDIAGRSSIVETDNGDGTCTHVLYDEHGNETSSTTVEVEALADETAPSAEITLADVAAALRDPLANLTASSASTTVRIAILNQRAALDALLAALETP